MLWLELLTVLVVVEVAVLWLPSGFFPGCAAVLLLSCLLVLLLCLAEELWCSVSLRVRTVVVTSIPLQKDTAATVCDK